MDLSSALDQPLDALIEKKGGNGPRQPRQQRGGGGGGGKMRSNRNRGARDTPYARNNGGGGGDGGAGNCSVYVGNLSWSTTWQTLKDHMRNGDSLNVTHADVMTEGGVEGGRSRGCGIVTYATHAEAATAIEELSETELDGRDIFVRWDEKGGARGGPRGGAAARGGPRGFSAAPPVVFSNGGGGYDAGYAAGLAAAAQGAAQGFVGQQAMVNTYANEGILPSATLYVGNLPWSVDWKALKDMFKRFGHVVYAEVATEGGPDSGGRSLGWGTVKFSDVNEATNAIGVMHGSFVGDRALQVRFDAKGGAGPGASRGPSVPGCKLYVGNLPWSVSWQDLKDMFKPYGDVKFAEVATEGGPQNKSGRSLGWGTVQFNAPEEASQAIDMMNGTEQDGRIIEVRLDRK